MSKLRGFYNRITTPYTSVERLEETLVPKGLLYVFNSSVIALPSLASHYIVITTPGDRKTLVLANLLQFTGVRVDTYRIENPDVIGGTPISPPPMNLNRDSIRELATGVSDNPTSVTGGTIMYGPHVNLGDGSIAPGNNKGSMVSSGDLASGNDYIRFLLNSTYVFRYHNPTTESIDLSVTFEMAEIDLEPE